MGCFEEICLGRGKGLGLGNLRIEMGQRDRSKKPLFSPGPMWFLSSRVFLCQTGTPNKGITTVPLASGLVEGGGGGWGNLWADSPCLVDKLSTVYTVNIVGSLEDQTNEYEKQISVFGTESI